MKTELRNNQRTYQCTRGDIRSAVTVRDNSLLAPEFETAKPGSIEHFYWSDTFFL